MTDLQQHLYVVDLVLMAFLLEGVCLFGYFAWTGRGLRPIEIVSNLASGAMLVLALRLALSGASSGAIATCLMGSFGAHVFDLRLRWRRSS